VATLNLSPSEQEVLATALRRGDVAYTLVIIWAFIGIAVKHAGIPLVAGAAWVATILAAIMLVVGVVLRRKRA